MEVTTYGNHLNVRNWKTYLEPLIHVFIWGTYFASINVRWTAPWIANSFLPESVAPHYAIAIPIIFLVNAYWLIPNFLKKRKWHIYILISVGFLIIFELLRAFIFYLILPYSSFWDELTGKHSLVFGTLNFLIFNFILWSFIFRFTLDWFNNQSTIAKLKSENSRFKNTTSPIKEAQHSYKSIFNIQKHNGSLLLKTNDIVYFKAQGDFVLVIDNEGKKHIINDSLKNIIKDLNPNDFFQINRSEIIHFNYFKSYQSYIKNRLKISLETSDDTLYTSNSRTPQFRNWLKLDRHLLE